jgi:hypothetical protein
VTWRHAERVRALSSRSLLRRPDVESLEGRELLAAVTDFPLTANLTPSAALTVGSDGNLWFPAGNKIARLALPGAVLAFRFRRGIPVRQH